eukprot:SAG22_NODE_424_length_10663_cov_93.402026_8_plen_112_part_00
MGVLGFIKDVRNKGIVGAAKKEGRRLGVMPSEGTVKMIGKLKDVAQDVNKGLMLAGHGSKAFDDAMTKVDSAGAKLQKANELSKGVASGDVASIVSAAGAGRKAYKSYKKK